MHRLTLAGSILLASVTLAATPNPAADWVVAAGQVVRYDTSNGPVTVANLRIEAGATLRVVGAQPFDLLAHDSIELDGVLDLSGFDAPPIWTLDTPQIPEPGAPGGPAGGRGGTGSWKTTQSTPHGWSGTSPVGHPGLGGGGGESGWNPSTASLGILRRAAGGGGGVLGPDRPLVPGDLEHPDNRGLVALPGRNGNPQASSAVTLQPPPIGGVVGSAVFVDWISDNDFFGRKPSGTGSVVVGELTAPRAGQGGGAGGDAVRADTFPPGLFIFSDQDKGAAGGGGGGLGILQARVIRVGPEGRILADGGDGGAGENTLYINRIGGGGAGGSGGMLVLQARTIDLGAAGPEALRARGGAGGAGANNVPLAEGGGGHGGPGLIQLHVPGASPARVLLPAGVSLETLTSPPAHVLFLEPGL